MSMSPANPVTPRPAATVMVVRPAGDSYEVFMVRRHQASKFAADVFVFPGGTIRSDDRLEPDEARAVGFEIDVLQAALAAHGDPLAAEPDGGLSLWSAALRELFEEAGVLLADGPDGAPVDLAEPARAAHFETLQNDL